jgi:hypothetical protein
MSCRRGAAKDESIVGATSRGVNRREVDYIASGCSGTFKSVMVSPVSRRSMK